MLAIKALLLTLLSVQVAVCNHVGNVAISMGEGALQNSKDCMVRFIKKMLSDAKIDDFDINFLGVAHISNMHFHSLDISEDDVDISIDQTHVHVHVKQMGGRLTGHSYKKVLAVEEYDFDINIKKGGARLQLDFEIAHRHINHNPRPIPLIKKMKIKLFSYKIDIDINSR